MKYKDVFLLWFWADLILGLGWLIVSAGTNVFNGIKNTDFGMILLIIGVGLGLSLPSLIALLFFHKIYSEKSILKKDYFKVYCIAILVINFYTYYAGILFLRLKESFRYYSYLLHWQALFLST